MARAYSGSRPASGEGAANGLTATNQSDAGPELALEGFGNHLGLSMELLQLFCLLSVLDLLYFKIMNVLSVCMYVYQVLGTEPGSSSRISSAFDH